MTDDHARAHHIHVRILACVLLATAVSTACAQTKAAIGPLSLEVPKGWLVADREGDNLKLTYGTIADENSTMPGTAKAVFDIYVDSSQTVGAFKAYLRKQHVGASDRSIDVDGYDGVLLSYIGEAVDGRQEAVFVPRWKVFILYRAAHGGDEASFYAGRPAFRRALRSIRFSGRPSSAPA